jgi:hypothetical protein
MAKKSKKVFKVDKEVNSGAEEDKGANWVRQKGQFETEADAQAWINEQLQIVNGAGGKYKIGKEDRI